MKKLKPTKLKSAPVSTQVDKPARLADMPDVLNLDDVASVLRTSRRGVYSLTRQRSQDGQHPLRVLRLPVGLRVLRSDLEQWLTAAAA